MLSLATVLLAVAFLILAYNHSQLLRRVEDLEIEKNCNRWVMDHYAEKCRTAETTSFQVSRRVFNLNAEVEKLKTKLKGSRYEI